ncbi:Mitogen-activated protein kinase kinase 9-like protein [Drosera capensis]
MALVRGRRHLNLTLHLPPPLSAPAVLLPPPPTPSSSISLSDLTTLSVLGHGNGGTVYKVLHAPTHTLYALKVLNPSSSSDPVHRRLAFREIDILRRTNSPFLVRCHAFLDNYHGSGGDSLGLLLEYMDSGSLETYLKNKGTLSESQLAHVARQVLHGLVYLHKHKIVHRDIKPANLLVHKGEKEDDEMIVKISDFGVSRIMARSLDPCNSYVGTCAYMSPERFDPDTYGVNYDGYAGDIWSLGLTLMELYLGHFPFLEPGERPDWATLMCAICFGDPPGLPEGVSEGFKSFLECCLQKESGKRWTAERLLTHPFLSGKDEGQKT